MVGIQKEGSVRSVIAIDSPIVAIVQFLIKIIYYRPFLDNPKWTTLP